jgi:hypothetical protein
MNIESFNFKLDPTNILRSQYKNVIASNNN